MSPGTLLICLNCIFYVLACLNLREFDQLMGLSKKFTCPRGHYIFESDLGNRICLPCKDGSFMKESNHGHNMCQKCSEVNNPGLEEVHSPCNSTHNAVIWCIKGYYLFQISGHERDCRPCTQCANPVRECKDDKDTVCCPGPNYLVEEVTDGTPTCVLYCGRGEYLDKSTSTCHPCPEDSFMDIERHRYIECKLCQSLYEYYLEILVPCNRTHHPLVACKKGRYMKKKGIASNEPPDCVPCQICQYNRTHRYEGRACDSFQDTICCRDPDMIVKNTSRGFQCQHRNISARSRTTSTSGPALDQSSLEASKDTDSKGRKQDSADQEVAKDIEQPRSTKDDQTKSSIWGHFKVFLYIIGLIVVIGIIVSCVICLPGYIRNVYRQYRQI